MVVPDWLRDLMVWVSTETEFERSYALAVLGDVALSEPPEHALAIARFLFDRLTDEDRSGKMTILLSLRDIFARFGTRPEFRELEQRFEDELSLELVAADEARARRMIASALTEESKRRKGMPGFGLLQRRQHAIR